MKPRTLMILTIVSAIAFASCGKSTKPIEKLSDIQGKVIGALANGTSDGNFKKMITSLIGGEPKEVVYFNKGMDLMSAIKQGKVDAGPCYQFFADYELKRIKDLKAISVDAVIEGGVIMVARSEDSLLKADLDKAITKLQENGTLSTLRQEWITNLPAENEPSSTEIPKIEKAKTVYVGVSGEYPPLDYIAANGRPAGFNVAIFREISELLKINFEFVSIEAQARFTALSSKKIDLIFTHFQSNNTDYYNEFKNNNWVSTIPYYTYKGGCFIVKK
jgi:ABC-type amino acid transport substrate-binding protein